MYISSQAMSSWLYSVVIQMHVVGLQLYAYSNHITTRFSIQTAGLAFGGTGLCSYRVRGVDGSCAKHLTVESYTVIYAANSHHTLTP